MQSDMKSELEKVYFNNQKDIEQYQSSINRLRDEKANESREVAKAIQAKN